MQPVWLTDTVTLDLDRALHYTLLWGLEGVVLRTVGTRADRVPHVNEGKIKRRLAEHDVAVAAVDPGLFEQPADERGGWLNDLALLSEVAQFSRRIGCGCIIVGALPGDEDLAVEALRRAAAFAERHALKLVLRNDIDGRATGTAIGALLDEISHPAIGAAWSPADALEAGEQPSEGLAAIGDWLALIMVRDGLVRKGRWTPRSLGEGEVEWEEIMRNLHARSYTGPLCLDLRDLGAAKEGLSEATTLIQMVRRAQRS